MRYVVKFTERDIKSHSKLCIGSGSQIFSRECSDTCRDCPVYNLKPGDEILIKIVEDNFQ